MRPRRGSSAPARSLRDLRILPGLVGGRIRLERFLLELDEARTRGGWREAGVLAARLLYRHVQRPVTLTEEYLFDRRLGIDTRGRRVVSGEVVAAARHKDGTDFETSSPRRLRRILASLPLAPEDFTFIDLGCGKGGALAVASLHGFRRVIGIELDSALAATALANAEVLSARSQGEVTVLQGDVCEFRFPADPTVLYMFNPFGQGTMGSVVASLTDSLRQDRRPVFVVYVHPVHHDVWERSDSFRTLRRDPRWDLYAADDAA